MKGRGKKGEGLVNSLQHKGFVFLVNSQYNTPMRKNLFLYLALACFVGLIVLFVVDGYLGVYDTAYIATGEQEYKIEVDVWQRQYPTYAPTSTQYAPIPVGEGKGVYYMPANRGDNVSFRYEVDNRLFSTYKADIEVSVWHSQEKVLDLIAQPLSISAFGKGELEWVVDNTELVPGSILPEQSYEYSVIIKRGGIERKIVMSVNPIVSK